MTVPRRALFVAFLLLVTAVPAAAAEPPPPAPRAGDRTIDEGAIALRAPGNRRIEMRLPDVDRTTAPGALGRSAGYRLLVTAADDGATALISIDGADAPSDYAFDFALPRGWRLQPAQGGVLIVDERGATVGAVAPPWATDAAGREVETRFVVRGTTLVQHVAHAGASYPVVADPSVTLGRNVYLWYRGYEIHWWGSSSAAYLSAAFCALYGALHPVACALSAVGALWIIRAFSTVFAGDRCRYVVAFRYWGWPNYMERLAGYGCTHRRADIPG